jgi:D-arabinono-1,4-lactone oxidase
MEARLAQELSRLDHSVAFRYTTKHVHHTWARTFYSRPEIYIQPQSVAEIQKAVTLARRCRRRLVVVGNAHSPSDLTCSSSWMMNLDHFNNILSVDRDSATVSFEAGISLHDLGVELAKLGLSVPNLGSIDVQSVAGAIATGTHGSSLRHGLLSQSVTALSLVLANGHLVRCSSSSNVPLFRAALLSLGSLGIITEITFQAVPDFKIAWRQTLNPLSEILGTWNSTLWTSAEYTRVWWMPYMRRAVVWRAETTDQPLKPPPKTWYGGRVGYLTYHNLLALCQWVPGVLPWVEWFVFGMQYGFNANGQVTMAAVEPGRSGLLMDCLYSQFVNEWALPLSKGPEAITRLGAWINGDDKASGIPFPSKDVWVHCPVEVRVTDATAHKNASGMRAFLDPTCATEPTLYLNATLYRPYNRDPPCRARYYQAFEYLMRELGGRPHWAKNFETSTEIPAMYGNDMDEFMKVRDENDPEGMFLGEWHYRVLPITESGEKPLGEREKGRRRMGKGFGDSIEWIGQEGKVMEMVGGSKKDQGPLLQALKEGKDGGLETDSPSPPATATSEESFDYLAKGEASVHE